VNAIDVLKYGHQTVLRAIDGLAEADWHTPGVVGDWSMKDVIAHLASFEHVLLDVLNTFLEAGPTPSLTGWLGEDFNDTEVPKRRDMTVGQVLAEYTDTQAETMVLAARISAETYRLAGALPWYGAEYALDDFLVYTYYGHKREHTAQIAVFRDRLTTTATT